MFSNNHSSLLTVAQSKEKDHLQWLSYIKCIHYEDSRSITCRQKSLLSIYFRIDKNFRFKLSSFPSLCNNHSFFSNH